MFKLIDEAPINNGNKVLLRVDWNLPVDKEGVFSDFGRLEASLPTIKFIKDKGAIPIVATHFGRKGESIKTLIDVAKQRYDILRESVEFLENLRIDEREESNDDRFAKELASKADIYVNDAFSVSHREHASIVGVPKYLPKFAGFRFKMEYDNLSRALDPKHPMFLILGGAKFETKLPIVNKFLNIADFIFIGGANAKHASETNLSTNAKIFFPIGDISALDANAETLEIIKSKISESQFVLWNGPLGNYEEGFEAGSFALARMIVESGKEAVVGGGDTNIFIDKVMKENNMIGKNVFVSLSGGAMLQFLAEGTLPGIEALV